VSIQPGARILGSASSVPAHRHSVLDLVGNFDTGDTVQWDATAGLFVVAPATSTTRPAVTPNAPGITGVSSSLVFSDFDVSTSATVTVTVTLPTTNTNTTSFYGAAAIALRWRYTDNAILPNPGTWHYVQSLGSQTSLSVDLVRHKTLIEIQVAVTDVYGNVSAWSTSTFHTTAGDVTAPGQPATPTVAGQLGTLLVSWNGLVTGSQAQPVDYAYTDIHLSTVSTFTPSAATRIGRFTGAGQHLVAQDPATGAALINNTASPVVYYVKLVSYDTSLNASTPSAAASAVPSFTVVTQTGTGTLSFDLLTFNPSASTGGVSLSVGVTAPPSPKLNDIWLDTTGPGVVQKVWSGTAWNPTQWGSAAIEPGVITASKLAAGAIVAGSAVIGDAAIRDAQIGSVSAAKITTGSLTATVDVTTGLLRVGTPGAASVNIDSTGIYARNSANATTFFLAASTGAFTINTNPGSTDRVVLDASGLKSFVGGAVKVSITATGNAIFNGDITAGSTITGATVIGSTIKTANVTGNAARVELTTNGLAAYNGTIQTVAINADGTASFVGTIASGSTITGASIIGGSLAIGGATFSTTIASDGQVTVTGPSGGDSIKALASSGTSPYAALRSTGVYFQGNASGANLFSVTLDNSVASELETRLPTSLSSATWKFAGTTRATLSNSQFAHSGDIRASGQLRAVTTTALDAWLGQWAQDGAFCGLLHDGAGSNSYMIVTHNTNGNTYVSAGQGGNLYLRTNNNDTDGELILNNYGGTGFAVATLNGGLFPAVNSGGVLGGTVGGSERKWDSVTATNYFTSSDVRLKTDIVELGPLGIELVRALRPVSYKWINAGPETNPRPGRRDHAGFLAQDVKAALDSLEVDLAVWSASASGEQQLRYDELIAPLVSAVQDLDARLLALEASVPRP
jgi:hypothetical protein